MLILIGAAILYLVGFGLLCLNIREGEYPPPPPYIGGKKGTLAATVTYLKETHSDRLYWYQWLGNIIGAIGGGAGGIGSNLSLTPFALLFYLAIGMSTAQIGYIFGTIGVSVGFMVLVTGWLADKYHPIRVAMAGTILGTFVVTPLNFIWLFWHFSPQTAFHINLAMAIFLMAPSIAMVGVYDPPLLMRLFPRSRFGQFCSVNAVWRSGGGMLSGILVGLFLDHLSKSVGKDRAYFFIPVWQFIFAAPGFFLLLALYRRWKELGGDKSYVAPVLQNKDEMADIVMHPPGTGSGPV
jgi:MFS family permease